MVKNSSGYDFTSRIHNDTYPFINPEKFDLSGKAVLITGASRGIGEQTALSFARAGASHIGIAARSDLSGHISQIQAAATAAGRPTPQVLSLKMDVSDLPNVEACAKEFEAQAGRLDILMNNAGFLEKHLPILESNPDDWKKAWEVNIFGVYHVTRAFLPLLRKSEGGLKTILMVSSIGAIKTSPGGSGYGSTKTAVLKMAGYLGVEYPEILCFSIHPGAVPTELASGLTADLRATLNDTPQLAADAVVWLTGERREWLAARYVSVTWDMEELERKRAEIEERGLLRLTVPFD